MKLNLKSKFYKVLLSFALLLTTAQAVFATSEDNKLGNENISVITEKIYDEETNTVDIKLTLEAKNTNVSLEGVTFPDESKKIPTEYVKESEEKSEDNTYVFTVEENGEYEFQANYALEVVGEDEQPLSREETYGFKVNVLEVKDKTETLSDEASQDQLNSPTGTPEATMGSNAVDGVITMNIPEYDGVGWNNDDIKSKTLSISVDFLANAEKPNKLEVVIPEGMRITSLHVVPGTDVSGIDPQTGIIAEYGDSSPHAKAIKKMTVPKQEAFPMKSIFGKVVYEFNDELTVDAITLDIGLSVDEKRFYGPHTVPEPVSATAYRVSTLTQEMGHVAEVIHATGTNGLKRVQYNAAPASQLLTSTAEVPTRSTAGNIKTTLSNAKSEELFALFMVYNFTYPKEFKVDQKASDSRFVKYLTDEAKGEISFASNWKSTTYLGVDYELPLGLSAGDYAPLKNSSVEVTFYDGHTITLELADSARNVKVIDENLNQLSLLSHDVRDVSGVPNHTVIGAGFVVGNRSGGPVTNQIFEMEIDGLLQTEK